MDKKSCIIAASGLALLATCIAVVIIADLVWFGSKTDPTKTPTPNAPKIVLPAPNPIQITLTSPAEGGVFPLNGAVPVFVDLASQQPLQGVRFWLDGVEIGAALPASPAISASFSFPATYLKTEGWHSLHATAIDQTGRMTISNVVHIKSAPAVGMETIYTTKDGDTLASIAAQFQADPASVQTRNSGSSVGLTDPLPAGQGLTIPFNPPAPPPQDQADQPVPQFEVNSSLPKPPSIQVQADQCKVRITLQEFAREASGYVLYRLDANNNVFSPLASFDANQAGSLVYEDNTASGAVQYVTSVYTAQGETLGNPVPLNLTAPGCFNASTLLITGNILSLPPSSNATYFYQSTGGNGYDRYPVSKDEFLTLTNGTFDLKTLASPDMAQNKQFRVNLEAWQWNAGKLNLIGTAMNESAIQSSLLICPKGLVCGGTGEMKTEYATSAVINSADANQTRTFKWQVDTLFPETIPAVLFQLSVQPFTADAQENPPGVIFTKVLSGKITDNSLGGTFDVNFKSLKMPETVIDHNGVVNHEEAIDPAQMLANASLADTQLPPWQVQQFELFNLTLQNSISNPDPSPLQVTCPGCAPSLASSPKFSNPSPTYYTRIIPLNGSNLLPAPSNTVLIEIKPLESGNITWVAPIPPIYEVQINSVKAPIAPSSHWGCVDIIAINPDSWVWTTKGSWFYGRLNEFKGYLNNQQPYCPVRYVQESKPWYQVLWDSVNDALTFLNKIYLKCKDLSIKSLMFQADVIKLGNLCSKCHKLVYDALYKAQDEILLMQYGAPAEIPNLDQLTDDGIDLLVEKAMNYVGLDTKDCDAVNIDCKKIISDALKEMKKEIGRQSVASYQDLAVAKEKGFYPLTLPNDPTALTVEPSKTQTWQMAEATFTVTRKPGPTTLSEDQLKAMKFLINVSVYATNQACQGKTYTLCTNIATVNGAPDNCTQQKIVLQKPCEGVLFKSADGVLDLLAPGESKEFTTQLLPQEYLNPEVPDSLRPYNLGDFSLLYLGAEATAQAHVLEPPKSPIPGADSAYFSFPLPTVNPSALLGGN